MTLPKAFTITPHSLGAFLILIALSSCSGGNQESNSLFEEDGFVKTSDGTNLYYNRIGNGPQNLIVPAALYLNEDLKSLASDERSIVFYDMRNRGKSDYVKDSTTLNIQQDVADLEEIRRHFKFEKTSLLGYSYLGLMVILYAKDHQDHVERIIQFGPVPLKFGTKYNPEYSAENIFEVIDSVEYAKMDQLYNEGYHKSNPQDFCNQNREVMKYLLVGNPDNVNKLKSVCELSNEWPVNLWRHFSFHFTSVQNLEVPVSDIQINKPVLTFHGTKDRNAPYGSGREWVFNLPDARLITVDGAAHNLWLETDVITPINIFLEGKWPENSEKVTASPLANEDPE